MSYPPQSLDGGDRAYHEVADGSHEGELSKDTFNEVIDNSDIHEEEIPLRNMEHPAPPILSALSGSPPPSSMQPSATVQQHQGPNIASPESHNEALNRSQSRSARIFVHTDGRGPTITLSQPPVSPTAADPSTLRSMHSLKESTGIKRANHPGSINLEGLQPKIPDVLDHDETDMDNQLGRTGVVGVHSDDHDRLAALADELDGMDSEAVSEQPAPGHAIIRDEAFLPGLATLPPGEADPEKVPVGLDDGGLTTPGTTSDGSYDPMDDLDNVDLIEGETDGMPSKPPRSSRKKIQDQGKTGWNKLRRLLSVGGNDRNNEDLSEKGLFTSEATNLKSVPVKTSSGVRGTRHRKRPSAMDREAAKLVRAHKLLHGHADSDASDDEVDHIPDMNRDHLPDSEVSTPDALDTAQAMDARPAETSGVLGQLLKLYDQQKEEESHADESQAPESVITSENGTSLGGGLNLVGHNVVDAYGNQAAIEDVDPKLLKQAAASKRSSESWRDPAKQSLYRTGGGLINLANQNITLASSVGQSVVKNVAADVGLDVMDERPKAARSGAGTIGGLIATTGNLIGAVSPLHAQLGPNPTRAGYTLDRYLLPDMNEKTLRRTAKIVAEAAPVPKKMRAAQSLSSGAPLTPNTFAAYVQSTNGTNPYFLQSDGKSVAGNSATSSLKRSGHAVGHAGKQLLHRKWPSSSASDDKADYFANANPEEVARREWKKKLRRRKMRSKKQEIFITMHVAAILKRQEFLLKLSRALMMFGAPTHRIEQQIQSTANVLEVNCRCVYFPSVMLLSFGDEATHTSETKIIKQGSVVDLTKLTDMHSIYWKVIHDKIGVEQGSKQLDALMRRKPLIPKWQLVIISGLASGFITVGEWGFGGSLLDAIASACLGAFMCFCQLSTTSELYSNVFEIVFATLNSFIAMGLHHIGQIHVGDKVQYGRYFCYQSVVAGSIVLILPGFIVLTAALELQSKNLVSGSVRLVYAIIYSVLLGLGIMIGALPLMGSSSFDIDCKASRQTLSHWYNTPPGQSGSPSFAWAFLTVPGYATLLSLRNQAKATRKEFPVMILIAICGWLVSNFAMIADNVNSDCMGKSDGHCPVPEVLKDHTYLYSAMGSFTVGILSNIYGRFFDGRSFVVSVPGILYQLPTGMTGAPDQANLWNFATNRQSSGNAQSSEVTSGLQIGAQLLNISLGIAIGLFASSLLMFFLGGRKVRGGGMFSF